MKHMKVTAVTFTFLCALSLTGCSNFHTGQTDNREVPSYSQTENQSGGESAANLDDLLETASLRGSVADFQKGSFQVVPDQDDGQTLIAAADGMESSMESTTVSYDENCIFQIAIIDSSTGAVELEEAAASDVKKTTSVYVYGETQDDGEIHAAKVLIVRFY